ncbi:MAG: hypothetical protein DCC52_15315 [Chloroflexi bacterium]|nr:MAG: hypothetical protein DCC52_15315 [Chloroflexota bacterium]
MTENRTPVLRVCKTWDECVQCEEVQKQVWDMPDFRDVVPASFLITAAKNGGILIGAFHDEQMIGFAFGFLGSEGAGATRRLKHTSHMLGVLPGVRVQGLGAQMKFLQREAALAQGLDLMTWTYDPLQAVNAQLNRVNCRRKRTKTRTTCTKSNGRRRVWRVCGAKRRYMPIRCAWKFPPNSIGSRRAT